MASLPRTSSLWNSRVLLLLLLICAVHGQNSTNLSKRGLVYIGTSHPSDYELFTSKESPLTWYYTFSTYPSLQHTSFDFVPMIHGASDVEKAVPSIQNMAKDITYVLTFNEPDGSTESGGSNVKPEEAAKIYLDTIAPLRKDPYNLKLSMPATTGSGLAWLQSFNQSCFNMTSSGCEFDFLAAHWYGGFPGLASWLGTLHEMYPRLPIWLTEFGLPAMDENITYSFVNQSLSYLDQLEYVERYSYFGTFREQAANNYTGPNVAMLNNDGGLTDIGALYLGGPQRGFSEGMKGAAGRIIPSSGQFLGVAGLMLAVTLWI